MKIPICRLYMVTTAFCRPLISLSAEFQKNNRVQNWPPSEMAESKTYHHQKVAESRTLVSLGVASPELGHF